MAQTVAKKGLAALPDLGSVMGENGYLHYNEDGVDYRFPVALLSRISVLATATGAKSIGLDLTTVWNVLSGRTRNLFEFLSDDKITAVLAGEDVDITTELQAAMDANCAIKIPNGSYYVTQGIVTSVSSSLIGDGPRNCVIDNRGIDHLFKFPSGYNRGWKVWCGFKVKSSNQAALKKYAFYFTGSATAGYLDYAASQWFQLIEFDGTGMGGGWYLQDCFRVTIRDCGATGHGNPFYIAGSVVQLTVDNYVNNGDNAPSMDVGSYGVYMTNKTYTDGNGIKTPEGITFAHCKFVKQAIGASAVGLFINFSICEFDYCWQYGGYYGGGSQVTFDGCYVGVQANRPNNFVGFMVPAQATGVAEKVVIHKCTVNMQANTNPNAANYTSKGIQVGNSTVNPIATDIVSNTFRGVGYDSGVHVVRGFGIKIDANAFLYTGVNIQVDECRTLWMCNNTTSLDSSSNPRGTYNLTTTDTSAEWFVVGNDGTFVTKSIVNPARCIIMNRFWTPYQTRTAWSPSAAINVSIPAGSTYSYSMAATADVTATYSLAGVTVPGLLWSVIYVSSTSVRVTFYNPTASTISLTGNLRVKTEWPPVG